MKVHGQVATVVLLIGSVCWLWPSSGVARKKCNYLKEITADAAAVSLDNEAGQPAEVDVTGYGFQAYVENLGFGRNFGKGLRDKRVLDVGAGWSNFVDVMADEYRAEAYAIDLAYGLEVDSLSAECQDLFHRRRIAMDAYRIQFPSNFFDLVVSHELFGVFFYFESTEARDRKTDRQRIQRGMDILAEMIRVTNPAGEIRVTNFPDPYGDWYAENYPDLVKIYRDAYETLQRLACSFTSQFPPAGEAGVTIITKHERCPKVDARSNVRVIVRGGRERSTNH